MNTFYNDYRAPELDYDKINEVLIHPTQKKMSRQGQDALNIIVKIVEPEWKNGKEFFAMPLRKVGKKIGVENDVQRVSNALRKLRNHNLMSLINKTQPGINQLTGEYVPPIMVFNWMDIIKYRW